MEITKAMIQDDKQMLEVVGSSNIHSIAYWPSAGRLVVTFINGSVYEYECVSKEAWDKFSVAESKGRYLNEHLKPRYPGRKLVAK